MQTDLLKQLYRPELFESLMVEDKQTAQLRHECMLFLRRLTAAQSIVNRIKDYDVYPEAFGANGFRALEPLELNISAASHPSIFAAGQEALADEHARFGASRQEERSHFAAEQEEHSRFATQQHPSDLQALQPISYSLRR